MARYRGYSRTDLLAADYKYLWRTWRAGMILVHGLLAGVVLFLILLKLYQNGHIGPLWCGLAMAAACTCACLLPLA